MAIDPKELRIGSHVLYNGKLMIVCRISGAVQGADISLIEPTEVAIYKDVWACYIEPIPITEELLTELGFEKTDIRGKEYWRKPYKEIPNFVNIFIVVYKSAIDGEYGVECNGNSNTSIEHLHELENFVYMTTKQELIKD